MFNNRLFTVLTFSNEQLLVLRIVTAIAQTSTNKDLNVMNQYSLLMIPAV